jgi:hypothetical protein
MEIKRFEFKDGIEYIKIHGLQRSGTNYLAKFVEDNLQDTKCLINAGGWKHGHYCAPWTLGREVHVLTITKNPYAWLASMYKYWKNGQTGPNLTNVSFGQFVRSPVIFEESAGTPFLLRASNPIQYWNNMNFHWSSIRINNKVGLMIPYEKLLSIPDCVIGVISEMLKIPRSSSLMTCNNVCEPGEECPKISQELWQDREYYKNEEYMNKFNPQLLNFVNSEIDTKVMSELQYDFIKG